MSRARIYARNLTANWVGYGLNLLIMFFLSPFVVHTLGDMRYGVWSVMMTMTGYLGLVEIGTRGGLGRYVNYYLGKGDIARLNGVVNTALAMFVAAGLILLVVTTGLIAALPLIPKIPDRMVPTARWVLLLVAINVWLSFFSATFRQLLIAHERFEFTNGVDLGVMILRAAAALVVLTMGGGLVLLALTHTIAGALGVLAAYLLGRHVFGQLELTPRLVSRERFRELFGFSIWAFIASLSHRLIYTTDTIVIAVCLGFRWVTIYAIGGMLLYKSRAIVGKAVAVFSPRMMQACAREDWVDLRINLSRACNLVMGICILLFGGLIGFGHEFIVLWMGPKYALSYHVLLILSICSVPEIASNPAGAVYFGLGRVRIGAILMLMQGVANLVLSLLFVEGLGWGVLGVAWGTFYPRIVFSVLGFALAMRWIKYSPRAFARRNLLRWVVGFLGLACLVLMARAIPLPPSWGGLFTRIAVTSVAYLPIGYYVVFEREDRRRVARAFRGAVGKLGRSRARPDEFLAEQ
jgi:O-antigen/teichoic acid export membrane protein